MTTNKININQFKQKYGYIRVSSKSEESNSSIESQTKELIHRGIQKKIFELKSDPMSMQFITELSFKN
jgi:hypothetical protein